MASNAPRSSTVAEHSEQPEDLITQDISPSNRRFWQQQVLLNFDFTVDSRKVFNVDTEVGQYPSALTESFAYWRHLKAYFRRSEFGFLRRIQYGELSLDSWPENEDPFTLYQDLMVLKKLVLFDGDLQTESEGEAFVRPVMLRALTEKTRQDLFMMCGFKRAMWSFVKVSKNWGGFEEDILSVQDERRERELEVAKDCESWESLMCDDDDHGDCDTGIFPITHEPILQDLEEIVHEHMTEFRRIKVEDEEDQRGPAFYIGKSKSERWLGFVGESQY